MDESTTSRHLRSRPRQEPLQQPVKCLKILRMCCNALLPSGGVRKNRVLSVVVALQHRVD